MISYYDNTGRIYGFATGDDETMQVTKANTEQLWVDGEWDGKTHYVKNGQALERQPCPATLTSMTLHNMPAPCKIVINSTEYEVTDKTVELEFDYPGVYKIKVLAFPYLDGEFEIEVTP